jgi:flagellar protein FliS
MQEQKLSSPDVNEFNRIKTISMLYEGASNFTKIARKKMEVGDSTGRSHYIKKTSAIITELSGSLNMDSGEIARNLRRLYDFVIRSLVTAETDNDLKALSDAEKVIGILESAWKEMQEARKY